MHKTIDESRLYVVDALKSIGCRHEMSKIHDGTHYHTLLTIIYKHIANTYKLEKDCEQIRADFFFDKTNRDDLLAIEVDFLEEEIVKAFKRAVNCSKSITSIEEYATYGISENGLVADGKTVDMIISISEKIANKSKHEFYAFRNEMIQCAKNNTKITDKQRRKYLYDFTHRTNIEDNKHKMRREMFTNNIVLFNEDGFYIFDENIKDEKQRVATQSGNNKFFFKQEKIRINS